MKRYLVIAADTDGTIKHQDVYDVLITEDRYMANKPGLLFWLTEYSPDAHNKDLEAVVESGVVTGVQLKAAPPTLYIHVTLAGGMQSPAGTLYLKNDGVDALQVHAELRDGSDPATSNAVTQLDSQDITAMWALELVNVDTRALADTPLVQMTAGVIDVSYTTTIAPCELELAENRLQPIGDYQLKLAQPVRFKIARALAA